MMPVFKQVLVIKDPKGTKECRNITYYQAREVTISNISWKASMVNIRLKHSTTRCTETQRLMILTFSAPQLIKLRLCKPPKPLHEYACIFTLKLEVFKGKNFQFCCSERQCFGEDAWCSPYLLQVINPSFWNLTGLCLSLDTHQEINPFWRWYRGNETTYTKAEYEFYMDFLLL